MSSSPGFLTRHVRGVVMSTATILLITATIAFWLSTTVYDSARFADTLTESLLSEEPRGLVARTINDKALANFPKVNFIVGEQTTALISGLLDTSLMREAVNSTVYEANKLITTETSDSVAIDISAIKEPLLAVVSQIIPNHQMNIDTIPSDIVIIDRSSVPSYAELGRALLLLGPMAILALFALIIFSWRQSDMNGYEYLSRSGSVLIIGSVVVLAMTWTSSALLTAFIIDPTESQLAQLVYRDFIDSLRRYLLVLLIFGAGLKIYCSRKINWWWSVQERFIDNSNDN